MTIPACRCLLLFLTALSLAFPALAGEADVVGVKVTKADPGVYKFAVTVRHGDTGWKHYAVAWEVLGLDGKVLGRRVLGHPHENEQPFTRYLTVPGIPQGVGKVRVRARDNVHDYGGVEMVVRLP